MKNQYLSADSASETVYNADLVALQPEHLNEHDTLITATRESISTVLQQFLDSKGYTSRESLKVKDGFLFLLNESTFAEWNKLSWWEQRRLILSMKDNTLYRDRVLELLAKSELAPHIHLTDKEVAKSTKQAVKQAWMRKRLLVKECFWNVLDSVSCAAYYQNKYRDQHPALCVLLCTVEDGPCRGNELVLGVDNGIGYVYKKKSRESTLLRLLYITYKLFFRKNVFYIGGLELGLMETESSLSCHGSGAVVYQSWES